MGLNIFHSNCSAYEPPTEQPTGNPNPRNFKILRYHAFKNATVVEVKYPDAKNYEGRKIMVYLCGLHRIEAQKVLDPHFCDDGSHLSPFARFEPTPAGWTAACFLAENA